MNTLTLKIPTTLQMSEFELAMIVASRLFDEGKLSSGQAAEMVGLSKKAFLEVAGKYDVSVFGYTADELKSEMKNA